MPNVLQLDNLKMNGAVSNVQDVQIQSQSFQPTTRQREDLVVNPQLSNPVNGLNVGKISWIEHQEETRSSALRNAIINTGTQGVASLNLAQNPKPNTEVANKEKELSHFIPSFLPDVVSRGRWVKF